MAKGGVLLFGLYHLMRRWQSLVSARMFIESGKKSSRNCRGSSSNSNTNRQRPNASEVSGLKQLDKSAQNGDTNHSKLTAPRGVYPAARDGERSESIGIFHWSQSSTAGCLSMTHMPG